MTATNGLDSRYRHQTIDIQRPSIEGGVEGLIVVLSREIDETIERLISRPSNLIKPDPVIAEKFTRVSGLVSSAYKRHGLILERTILERLKQCPWFRVWNKKDFQISSEAWAAKLDTENLEYGSGVRNLQVDAFVYDTENKSLKAYEIKRGFAYFDSGKRISIREELKAIQVLLSSYGKTQNLDVQSRSSHVIFWYGKMSIKEPYGLRGKQMDEHLNWPVFDAVERVNSIFKDRLDAALTQIVVGDK